MNRPAMKQSMKWQVSSKFQIYPPPSITLP